MIKTMAAVNNSFESLEITLQEVPDNEKLSKFKVFTYGDIEYLLFYRLYQKPFDIEDAKKRFAKKENSFFVKREFAPDVSVTLNEFEGQVIILPYSDDADLQTKISQLVKLFPTSEGVFGHSVD